MALTNLSNNLDVTVRAGNEEKKYRYNSSAVATTISQFTTV